MEALTIKEYEDASKEGYDEGFFTGYLFFHVEFATRLIKMKKQSSDIAEIEEINKILLDIIHIKKEAVSEIEKVIEKYPNYNGRTLAKKVMYEISFSFY